LTRVQQLGVPDFTVVRYLSECCGTDDHRAGKRTTAYLVHSNNRVCIEEELPIFATEDVNS
jgi:hypothetical protein